MTEITDEQRALPVKPGVYTDSDGQAWQLQLNGDWTEVGVPDPIAAADARRFAPFIRLVPERPQITQDQALGAVVNVTHSREYSATRETTPVQESMLADALLALVNGADQ